MLQDEGFVDVAEEGKFLVAFGTATQEWWLLKPSEGYRGGLYTALCDLRESGSGATTAQHMLEALNFLDATARLVLIDLRTVISGRCKGVAKDMFLMKNLWNRSIL